MRRAFALLTVSADPAGTRPDVRYTRDEALRGCVCNKQKYRHRLQGVLDGGESLPHPIGGRHRPDIEARGPRLRGRDHAVLRACRRLPRIAPSPAKALARIGIFSGNSAVRSRAR